MMRTSGSAAFSPVNRRFSRIALSAILLSAALVGSAQASQESDRQEQRRYAVETVNLSYEQYLWRQSDFRASNCTLGWPASFADLPVWSTCTKPSPYNAFDWTDDGCSGREQIGFVSNIYRDLFNQPCRQHDFGYRNFGKGLTLDRSESRRAWIDSRFLSEMKRLCNNSFPSWWQAVNKQTCFKTADVVHAAVRRLSDWSAPLPAPPSGPISALEGHDADERAHGARDDAHTPPEPVG